MLGNLTLDRVVRGNALKTLPRTEAFILAGVNLAFLAEWLVTPKRTTVRLLESEKLERLQRWRHEACWKLFGSPFAGFGQHCPNSHRMLDSLHRGPSSEGICDLSNLFL